MRHSEHEILTTYELAIGYAQKRQPVRVVAEGISISLSVGAFVCLIGPNGAGKSTLLRTLAGMQRPLAGKASLEGVDIHRLKPQELAKRLSIVLTERIDVGNLSACELVAMGRYPYTDWTGRLTSQDERVVRWAIQVVGAENLSDRYVNELSDGERQKVMIARALAQEPTLMILDEPTAFLDLPRRVEVMQLLRDLAHNTTERAILLSTHDLDLALRSADQVWLLPAGGPLRVGAPEDLVLSGAFEQAFRSEGATFDADTGAFKMDAPANGRITLVGNGRPAFWTQQALERAGFAVAQDDGQADARLEIASQDGGPCWRLTVGRQASEYRSLAELVSALQNPRRELNHSPCTGGSRTAPTLRDRDNREAKADGCP